MANILLTGGRAPATLELARAFHAAGHRVFMAESVNLYLSQASRAIVRYDHVPAPNRDLPGYVNALLAIVRREGIDWLIPTCEEIFYVAQGRDRLAAHCTVFVEPLEKLHPLHNKWLFVQKAMGYGLKVPPTTLLNNDHEMRSVFDRGGEIVLKPVYSRFAAKTVIRPRTVQEASPCRPTLRRPWVAQQFIHGRQICTYSLAHAGHLTAHAAYPTEFTAGQGATILFRALDHPAVFEWVQTFVANEAFTGQIAFDFIETPTSELYALECNPRATSGAHLLAANPQFVPAFLNPALETISPPPNRSAMVGTAMVLYALLATRSWAGLKRWVTAFTASRDVVFNFHDPLPAFFQFAGVGNFLWWSLKHRISAIEASTFDIEWNGPGTA